MKTIFRTLMVVAAMTASFASAQQAPGGVGGLADQSPDLPKTNNFQSPNMPVPPLSTSNEYALLTAQTKAIKALTQRIAALEARVQQLEASKK